MTDLPLLTRPSEKRDRTRDRTRLHVHAERIMASSMAISNSPHSVKSRDTRMRLERSWKEDINWDLYPPTLKLVSEVCKLN